MMPGIDGFEVAARIQAHPEWGVGAVLMLSSAGSTGFSGRCRALGLTAYLIKPVFKSELRQAIENAMVTLKPQPERPAIPVPARSLDVLLAEDNYVNSRLVLGLLEKRGHRVAIARTGKEAVQLFRARPFDLVLMDVQMPDMNGFEATAELRRHEAPSGRITPIIALTAHAMAGDEQRCLEAGMDAYLSKPLRPARLFELIQTLTSSPAEAGAPAAPPSPPPAPTMNRDELMDRVEGDRDLLRELYEQYRHEYPQVTAEARDSLAKGDAEALARAAHALKGMLASLASPGGTAAADALERLAHGGDLSNATAVLHGLEEELARLDEALQALTRGGAPDQP
jgi:CheY-like chemotaxis protein/HPt (histidine-containing phosphotransfer) domain-containing protein